MDALIPIAIDIETTGFDRSSRLTVVGFAHDAGEWIVCNTDGNTADADLIRQELEARSTGMLELEFVPDAPTVLDRVAAFVATRIDGDRHYLTAYNGETWNGGFDLPFLRTMCVRHARPWPFGDIAYVDAIRFHERFAGLEGTDLASVYDGLIGGNRNDPFESSEEAVTAFERGEWGSLVAHNLADIQRTRTLARLAGQFVPKSDFRMKNLRPPSWK